MKHPSISVIKILRFALGCIQSLKCHTNKCPTGITTNDPKLIEGLDIPTKAMRVKNYQSRTMLSACELIGACGKQHPREMRRSDVNIRIDDATVRSYEELYPTLEDGCLLRGEGPEFYQEMWDKAAV